MAFTNEQLERYSRHIILKEIGVKGQKKAPECESSDYRCWRTGCTGCDVSGSCWRWYDRHC